MATLLKCKMCGGTLETQENETVAKCKYCGSLMTLPKVDSEKKIRIFNRANEYRFNAEFDQAFEAYKAIATENPEEPEAYWGMVLSEYGIEYVEDPKTGKRVPTCHRASPTSIKNSSNFKLAVQYADAEQKMMYEDEAKEIDQIQKRILAVSAREEPYDVFICYKETDDTTGERTTDSVLAQNIYDELVRKNIRTFFSRITLEDKLGVDYEPYIYAALRSAKVMLVVTENPENCEAVWVKNEWMRFLNFMKEDSSKTIIPVYQKITAYELPSELARFQAQDMSKIGAIQDLVRGVRKLIRPNTATNYTVVSQVINTNDTAPLLKRAFIFLEDGNYQEADEYCEKVLDMDPENANAYLGKLLAEKQLSEPEELKNLTQPFDSNNNYQKILRYGNSELIASVKGYIDFINNRNKTERLTGIYNDALLKMNAAKSEEEYKAAAQVFNTLDGFKDADVLAQKCLNRAEETRKDNVYSTALSHIKAGTISEYKKAISLFRSILGWKDAESKINECQIKIEDLQAKEEAERVRREHQKAVAKQTVKRVASFVTPLITVGIVLAIVVGTIVRPQQKVNEAMRMIEAGNIEEGYAILEEMGKQNLIIQNKYDRAISFIENGDYSAASELLAETNGDEKIADERYNKAIEYINNENYVAAYYLLDGFDYKDSKEHLVDIADKLNPQNVLFKKCEEEIISGNYKEAKSTLSQLEEMQLGSEYNDAFIRLAETAAEADNSSMVRRIIEITGDRGATENLNNYLVFDDLRKIYICNNRTLSQAKDLLNSLPEDYPGVREYKDLFDLYGDYIGAYNAKYADNGFRTHKARVFITEGRAGVEKFDQVYYFTYPNLFTDESDDGNIWTLISTSHVQRTDNQNRVADYADYYR